MAETGRKSTEIYRLPPVVRVFTQPGSILPVRLRSRDRPESAHLARCRTTWRRSPNRAHSGHSASAEATALDVESPGGLSPPGAPRSVREPLDSYGSRCSAVSMAELPVGEECWIYSA